MKRRIKPALFWLLVVGLLCLSGCTYQDPLLTTAWGQRDSYALFTPINPTTDEHERAGCWSTALAQILYYHRLLPTGTVAYTTTGSEIGNHVYTIDEDLNFVFDWQLFVDSIGLFTPQESVTQVAQYVYYTSIVIQKDFGTGTYLLSHISRAAAIAQYYGCEAHLFDSNILGTGLIKQIIIAELDAMRPVMMHLRNCEHTLYHAVVVDGYTMTSGDFFIHINMGREGTDDGWYMFDEPILNWNDTVYRKIITIKP